MNRTDATRLVDILIEAHHIAYYIDEKESPLLFSDLDQLCSDLRDHVIAVLAASAPVSYGIVNSAPMQYTKTDVEPPWTVTCTGIDPMSKEMK